MREHMGLFRGKRTDNGEWVKGSLYIATLDNAGTISKHFRIQDITYGSDENGFPDYMSGIDEEVNPDTVGECTGMTDKNGKLIFEGDILQDQNGVFYITHDEGTFKMKWSGHPHFRTWIRKSITTEQEIIGNIHDTPELIGGST